MEEQKEYWEGELFYIIRDNRYFCGLCEYECKAKKICSQKLEKHFEAKHCHLSKEQLTLIRENKRRKLDNDSESVTEMSSDLSEPTTSLSASAIETLSPGELKNKTVYEIANLIAKKGLDLSIVETFKEVLQLVADNLFPEKSELIKELPLSRQTITERIKEISLDIDNQLKEKEFQSFSLSFDESTDITDNSFLPTFIRGVNSNFEITEELCSAETFEERTTGKDIFERLPLNNYDLQKLSSVTTDGHPNNTGPNIGAIKRVKDYLISQNINTPFLSFQCLIHQEELCGKHAHFPEMMKTVVQLVNKIKKHSLIHRQFRQFETELINDFKDLVYFSHIRWLSRGDCLKRFFDNYDRLERFYRTVLDKTVKELTDNQWYFELGFYTDICLKLNNLKLRIMGKNKFISQQYKELSECEQQLVLMRDSLINNTTICDISDFDFSELECVRKVLTMKKQSFNTVNILSLLNQILTQFDNRFSDFRQQKYYFEVFQEPFTAQNIPLELQYELTILRSNIELENLFNESDLKTFYFQLNDSEFPRIKENAYRVASHFGSTYRCEQFFKLLKSRKTATSNRYKDKTLIACLRIATTNLTPNIIRLSKSKTFMKSH